MRLKILSLLNVCIGIIGLIYFTGCADKYKPTANEFVSLQESSCTHCHLNSDLLKEVAEPIDHGTGEAGEG
ncbi:hypothetical protein JW960_05150 [candidate division KSB1 bacterium]|nr:hypothetical protein [candidate division KSB1 bacterium]